MSTLPIALRADRPAGRDDAVGVREHATRGALVRAAAGCFAEAGFARTRISDIAARAGIGKGTVYEHFAAKEDLLLAACLAAWAERRAQLTASLPADPEADADPLAAIAASVTRALSVLPRLWRDHGRMFCDLLSLAERQPDLRARLRDGIAEAYAGWEDAIARLHAEAVARGLARAASSKLVPRLLAALLDGVTWQRSVRGDGAVDGFAAEGAALIVELLRAPAAREGGR